VDDPVSQAFAATPRAWFLAAADRPRAGFDGPIGIGLGQTNSQPRTVEAMLRLLEVAPGHRVLDIGAGSGWTTALLAHLTGPDGAVDGVELLPALADLGSSNLERTGRPWATVRLAAAGVLGLPDQPPYDRILVSAEARTLPDRLVAQLAPGGRLVIPVRGRMLLVVAGPDWPEITEHGRYRFVPLR